LKNYRGKVASAVSNSNRIKSVDDYAMSRSGNNSEEKYSYRHSQRACSDGVNCFAEIPYLDCVRDCLSDTQMLNGLSVRLLYLLE
jgi:hypothetical protein